MLQNKRYLNWENCLKLIIFVTLAINALSIFFPLLRNDDPPLYANIAKHIVISHDWIFLIANHTDWLDKPHLPFWLIAASFKVFGISSFGYFLPGFIFYLIGCYYTYLLALYLYNRQVALLSTLIYVSSFHLMLSNLDMRAEVYLLGSIIPASYYWLLYNDTTKFRLKYLLLGAFYTALAMMTKGIFVLVTITSGIILLWLYQKKLSNFLKPKWLIALLLSFIFIFPELYSLYLQFDIHPEKLIFNNTHVSGIKWFFWDSQFGRFFNTGPITTSHPSPFHYFFFIHTFLWAFLPWSLIFIVALYEIIKSLIKKSSNLSFNLNQTKALIFLFGAFIPTFIMFSLTSFQLDFYTNIIIPYASIISAYWLTEKLKNNTYSNVFYFQVGLAIFLTIIITVLGLLAFDHFLAFLILFLGIITLILFILLAPQALITKAIVYPVLAINLVFIFSLLVNGFIYTKYDAGYKIAMYLKNKPHFPIIDYKVSSLTLEFHSVNPYYRLEKLQSLKNKPRPYYLLIKESDLPLFKAISNNYQIIWQTSGTNIDMVLLHLLSRHLSSSDLTDYLIILQK